jgi:hypothetical protein
MHNGNVGLTNSHTTQPLSTWLLDSAARMIKHPISALQMCTLVTTSVHKVSSLRFQPHVYLIGAQD